MELTSELRRKKKLLLFQYLHYFYLNSMGGKSISLCDFTEEEEGMRQGEWEALRQMRTWQQFAVEKTVMYPQERKKLCVQV